MKTLQRLAMTLLAVLVGAGVHAQSTIEEFPIQVVSGDTTQSASVDGQTAFVFFLPNNCPACDEFSSWIDTVPVTQTEIVWVTNAPREAVNAWADAQPGPRNIWIDTRNEFARAAHVEQVPSIRLFRDGLLVTQDTWPFYGERDGLVSNLMAFDAGEFEANVIDDSSPSVEVLRALKPSNHVLTNTAGEEIRLDSIAGPSFFIICTPECQVCEEEAAALQQAAATGEALPDITIIMLTRGNGREHTSAWHDTPFPVLTVPLEQAGALAPGTTPTHFSLSHAGTVDWIQVGYTEAMPTILAEEHARLTERGSP